MFARELNRRSELAGWGILSTAAHPGGTITNLQLTGPSYGRDGKTLAQRINDVTYRIPWLWQHFAQGILPALYAATSPDATPAAITVPPASLNSPAE